ncbi:MAG: SufE family protein [Deltaproteobacteria bacterium]|nr:SufE family protein [Deltaproteobacteria bacterium]
MTLDDIRESFEILEGWEERYRYLIDLGKRLEPMDPADKNDATKVEGCMSQVWMVGRPEVRADGKVALHLLADSDASIVRGLIAVLMAGYDRRPVDEILTTDIEGIFDTLGLGQHISMNRRNGFHAMVVRIRREAERARQVVESGSTGAPEP